MDWSKIPGHKSEKVRLIDMFRDMYEIAVIVAVIVIFVIIIIIIIIVIVTVIMIMKAIILNFQMRKHFLRKKEDGDK